MPYFLFSLSLLLICLQGNCQEPYLWQKLDSNINTINQEKLPIPNAAGDTFYFERQTTKEQNNGEIYYSVLHGNKWSVAKNVGVVLNNKGNNFVCTVLDNELLLGNTYTLDGEALAAGGAMVKRQDNNWTRPQNLKIDGQEITSKTGSLFLSHDQQILLISYSNSTSNTDIDIYFSRRINHLHYSKPQRMGNVVNSTFAEINPFLNADSKVLYFASNKPGGIGGYDIYSSNRLDSTWQNWSIPINAGIEYNSSNDEKSFSTTPSANWAFMYGHEKNSDNSDIFFLYRPTTNKEQIKGKIQLPNQNTQPKINLTIASKTDSTFLDTAKVNSLNGCFEINLPTNDSYQMYFSAIGYMDFEDSFAIKKSNNFFESKYPNNKTTFTPLSIAVGNVVNLEKVVFMQGKWDLLPISFPSLDRLTVFLKNNPKVFIELGGHTDNHGDPDLNLSLSEYRVKEVRKYLIQNGIAKTRIAYKSYGGTKPIASNASEITRKQNRRVDFKITKYETANNKKQ